MLHLAIAIALGIIFVPIILWAIGLLLGAVVAAGGALMRPIFYNRFTVMAAIWGVVMIVLNLTH